MEKQTGQLEIHWHKWRQHFVYLFNAGTAILIISRHCYQRKAHLIGPSVHDRFYRFGKSYFISLCLIVESAPQIILDCIAVRSEKEKFFSSLHNYYVQDKRTLVTF